MQGEEEMTTATTSANTDDRWLRAAMADEAVVAELLVRMKQARASRPAKAVRMLAPPPGWGLRLPRSRPSFSDSRRKEASDSTRRSPTTPLSWSGGSGGGSPSATADGFEESSSGRRSSSVGRSKGIGADETASNSILSKRMRKKSFAQLKDEESLLLKERISLKKEISTLHATCTEQRATNENLKKMKFDLNIYSATKLYTAYDEPQQAASGQYQMGLWPSLHQVSSTHHKPMEKTGSGSGSGSSRGNLFLLPDLNMVPSEDDFGSETLYGMS